jgi:hypothetical protein
MARFGKDLGLPAQKIFDPGEERTGVAMIGKPVAQAREASDQRLQEQARSIAIADIGSMHQDGQDQALRINEPVALATKDFFPAVETAFAASHGTGFDRYR